MSIEAVRRLRDKWQSEAALVQQLEQAFDKIGFTLDYVAQRKATPSAAVRRLKDIKDNVWGMIEVEDSTLRLLDSPIVQRLRGIKQLGFTYLTYPTGEHSRFVHSLGVAHVVSRFLNACRKHAAECSDSSVSFVAPDDLRTLKEHNLIHAAILHDAGHMPYSHASETVLEERPKQFTCGGRLISRFLLDIETELEKNLSLSEGLSLLIVLSSRFGSYYRDYVDPGASANSLLAMAALIAGKAPVKRLAGIPSIISSAAVDSDKIDYINRDALNCGIPIGLDIERLFLRSGLVRATKQQLRHLKDDPADEEIHFIVNASGVDALEEITDARAALYQRVYLHPVTRTAEAVFGQALKRHGESGSEALQDALDIWTHSDDTLLRALRDSPDSIASKLADNLSWRELPKKACAFSTLIAEPYMPLASLPPKLDLANQTMLARQISNAAVNYLAWEELRDREKEAKRVADVERRIREEAELIVTLISDRSEAGLVPASSLQTVLLVRGAYSRPKKQNGFVLQGDELLRMSDFTTKGEQQEAVDIFKASGFIMSDPEWRYIVLVAARTVIFSLFGEVESATFEIQREQRKPDDLDEARKSEEVQFARRSLLNLDRVIGRANLDRDRVYELMDVLNDVGYFDKVPVLARRTDPDDDDVAAIARKLSTFEGQRSWRVTPEIVLAFIDQFPPRLRPEMKRALTELRYFNTEQVSQSIFGTLGEPASRDIVPLSPTSGTGTWTTLKREAEGAGFGSASFCPDLRSALAKDPSRPLVLVDDNVASATQARAQFLTWLDIPRAEWPDQMRGENNLFETPLEPGEIAAFKQRNLTIAVCAARDTSDRILRGALESLGFSNFQGLRFGHDLGSHPWSDDLRGFLTSVGRSILAWSRFGKTEEELTDEERQFCSDMAFGYANAGGLTATASNVPSSTVTALWSPGLYRGSPWMPLLIRQKRLGSLILG